MEDSHNRYHSLRLAQQLCFPLYAASKEVIRNYKPLLDTLDLTYTQYITMMVLWEEGELNVKSLGERLLLDSGTLTPMLKKLEAKGYITRKRAQEDERNLSVSITDEGLKLQDKALSVPAHMRECMQLSDDEIKTLYDLLYRLIGNCRA